MYHEDVWHCRELCHWREVAENVVWQPGIESRADRERAHRTHRKCLPIAGSVGHMGHPDVAACSRLVLDDHGLAEYLLQPFGDRASDDVCRPTGWIRDDQTHRLRPESWRWCGGKKRTPER